MDDSVKIPCLFIPVKRFNLLLPNSAIAEVVANIQLNKIDTKLPWLAGTIKWQNESIAVVAFDNLEGQNHSEHIQTSIIVVIRNPMPSNGIPFFGLLVKSIPQVIDASSYNIDVNPHPTTNHSFSLASILVDEKEAIIPNIEILAKFIASKQNEIFSANTN